MIRSVAFIGISIAVLLHQAIAQESCLPEGITFFTQEQIDSFQDDYPGCTEIEGNVSIAVSPSITNLQGLNVLTSIDGYLVIFDIYGLLSLDGLNNLTTIGGNLSLDGNHYLTDLTGLENLASIGGSLSIGQTYGSGNGSLVSLAGLENLTSIGGDLNIRHNISLASLDGIENLQANSIEDVRIYDQPLLTDCAVQSMCDYLAAPNGTVEIHDNAQGCDNTEQILEICDMAACLPEGITFTSQGQVDNFQVDYPGCTEIEGDVIITGGNITNLEGLNVLTYVNGDLYIGFDPEPTVLTNLSGLESLQSVGGSLSIYKNGALTSIGALGNLSSVGNDLLILQNEVLPGLVGLEGLDTIPGNLIIRRNYQLTSMEPLQGIASVGGDLRIMLNDELADLQGLQGITSVPGDVVLFNEQMASLDGLDNLASIGGNLQIGDQDVFWNTQLFDLSALQDLEQVGGVLAIYWNQVLESLGGLENIDGGSIQHMEIIGNPALSHCEVQSICDYLAAPNGTAFIGYNAPGCNSIEEVEEACEAVGMHERYNLSFSLRPVIAGEGLVSISVQNSREKAYYRCFNMFGQEVHSARIMDGLAILRVSSWQAGVYLVIVHTGKRTGRARFLVP